VKDIFVNGYSDGWLRQGFCWVYPNEVTKGSARPGSEVRIRAKDGTVLGRGLADQGWIAVRVYRRDDGPLDDEWLWQTLDRAATLRDQVVDPGTTGYRLVHAENDGLPGLRIDWWDHFAVIAIDSPAVGRLLPGVLAWLEDRRSPRGVYLCYRPDPRDTKRKGTLDPAPGLLTGRASTGPVVVRERGMSLLCYPAEGPDVGVYADMREVRAWLEPHWGGKAVLNAFAYTGAFSVAAALGGASDIVTVDLSSRYLDRAEANFTANDLDPSAYEFLAMDVFKAFDRLRRTGQTFDLVVLDPPSFSHSKAGVWSAKRDWPRLVSAAARLLEPGGWIVAASNQGELSPRDFRGHVARGLKKVSKRGQEIFWGGQGPDFPAATWFPEGRYLKVGVWRVVS